MPYAAFISSNDIVGSLHNTNSTDEDLGFLSFVRLVGTNTLRYLPPIMDIQLYNLVDISLPVSQRHEMWPQKVR